MAFVSSSIFFSASLGPVGFGGVTLNGNNGGGGDSAAVAAAAEAIDEATIGVDDDVAVRYGDDDDALDDKDAAGAA